MNPKILFSFNVLLMNCNIKGFIHRALNFRVRLPLFRILLVFIENFLEFLKLEAFKLELKF